MEKIAHTGLFILIALVIVLSLGMHAIEFNHLHPGETHEHNKVSGVIMHSAEKKTLLFLMLIIGYALLGVFRKQDIVLKKTVQVTLIDFKNKYLHAKSSHSLFLALISGTLNPKPL